MAHDLKETFFYVKSVGKIWRFKNYLLTSQPINVRSFAMMETVLLIILLLLLLGSCVMIWYMRNKMRSARKSERIIQAFLQNINHEIRNPLKVVNGLADTVSKEDLYLSKNEKRNIADQLRYSTSLIGTLMDEVMMFTGADETGHQLKLESFSPNALCRRCLEANLHSIYHRQAVTLKYKRGVDDEFFIKSDIHLVELVVNKLIINACRFTEEGHITAGCSTTEYPDRLAIYVADTGIGIPENRMGSLFSYFERPDDMKDEAELDLSICHRLAEKLGGELLRDAYYTGGTRMVLVLPLTK